MRRIVVGAAVGLLSWSLVACGSDKAPDAVATSSSPTDAPTTAPPTTATSSPTPTATSTPTEPPTEPPCDISVGTTSPNPGCPEATVSTGWVKATGAGKLTFRPFRTLGNDADGQAYAQKHGLEYPFPNDYYDAPAGEPRPLTLADHTACTGIMLVSQQDPMADRMVPCTDLVKAAKRHLIPVTMWSESDTPLQISEVYRP